MAVTKAYKDWYSRKKGTHNAARRERYANDPLYREAVQTKIRATRAKKNGEKAVKTIYTIKDAAEISNSSTSRIRTWESLGFIPKKLNEQGYRIYTLSQCHLIKHFVILVESVANNTPALKAIAIEEKAKEMAGVWDAS